MTHGIGRTARALALPALACLCGLAASCGPKAPPAPAAGEGELKHFTGASEGLQTSGEMAKAMARRAESAAQWAAAFREAASVDLPAALKQFRAEEAFAFLTAHPSYRELPAVWTHFFCNAMPVMASPGRNMMNVAYYNPFLDAAVITLWQWGKDKEGPTILRATIRSTDELCNGEVSQARQAPAWLASATLPQEALSIQYRRFLRAAMPLLESPHEACWQKLAPASPRTLESTAVVQARLLDDLIRLQKGPLGPSVRGLCQAVQAGDADAVARTLAPDCRLPVPDLSQLPLPVRQNAVPLATTPVGDGALVFLGNPRLMETYFVALLQTGPKVQLKMFGVYSLIPVPAGRPTGVSAAH